MRSLDVQVITCVHLCAYAQHAKLVAPSAHPEAFKAMRFTQLAVTLTRDDYESHLRRTADDLGIPRDAQAGVIRAMYPKASSGATAELHCRGFEVCELDASRWAKAHGIPKRAGNYLWTADSIDKLADELERRGKFTRPAMLLASMGVSTEQFLETAGGGEKEPAPDADRQPA
jgi:hypothetical protein